MMRQFYNNTNQRWEDIERTTDINDIKRIYGEDTKIRVFDPATQDWIELKKELFQDFIELKKEALQRPTLVGNVNNKLTEWQQSLFDDYKEIGIKIHKYRKFKMSSEYITSTSLEKELLDKQAEIMAEYWRILGLRLDFYHIERTI